jgi:predicted RNase H-like nuclease (RuvC/YqgF family)
MIPINAIPKAWLIVAALALALGAQSWRLDLAQADVDRLEVENANLKSANDQNQTVITGLSEKYNNLVNSRAADLERAEAAVARARLEAEQLKNQLESSRTEREIIYAENSDADQWGRTVVPAAIADSLRH